MRNYKKPILYFIIISVVFVAACSPETRYKVLSFVFDGVPDQDFLGNIALNDSIYQVDSTEILVIAKNQNIQKNYIHQPYLEKDCKSCHDNTKGLVAQPELCYTCHENFEDDYKIIHGPVAGGYCTSCHDPHKSKITSLLKRENEALCSHCHDPIQLASNDLHSIIEITNCTECHNPHGEENTFLLKDGTCYLCHEDFSEKYAYLHGPVGGGFCNSCHETHMSDSEHKLSLKGQSLCLKCHNTESVFKNENHEGTEEYDCMECHNPHGGEDKFILN